MCPGTPPVPAPAGREVPAEVDCREEPVLVKWTKSVLCFAFSPLVLVLFEISVSGGPP